jgi:poly(3-hydroxybutyrate) depolymerase
MHNIKDMKRSSLPYVIKKLVAFLSVFILCFSIVSGQPDTLYRTISHDSLTRYYILYVPEAYDGTEAWPLVINLHSYASFPYQQMVLSEMNVVADTGHFLIVYPEGTPVKSIKSGTVGPGWNNGMPSDTTLSPVQAVDDVDFISNLIDAIGAEYLVDPARVYATGLSNGSVMSNVLGCDLSERIAAIAPVAGTAHSTRPCNPLRKIPVLQIHGTEDTITYYETGNAEIRIGVPDYLNFWIDFNGCGLEPTVTLLPDLVPRDSSTVEIHAWERCGAELVHYKVIDGGHIWPGFDFSFFPELGNSNLDINASSEIWNFFKRNPRKSIVCTGDIHLNSQEDVNHFTCNKVEGDLTIAGADITDLSPLIELDSIEGDLLIEYNAALTNLDGMNNLAYVGGRLSISGNDTLTNIDGLTNLTSVGGNVVIGKWVPYFDVDGNNALTNIDGLMHLNFVGGNVQLLGNSALTNLDGLANLTYVGGSVSIGDGWISGNPALTNLDGLANLVYVEGNLKVAGNDALTNLDGLTNLTHVGGMVSIGVIGGLGGYDGNATLTNLDGLANLAFVGEDISIIDNPALTNLSGLVNFVSVEGLNIFSNAALTNLDELTNLTSVREELAIAGNAALTNINGLTNLTSVGELTIGEWYDIGGNPLLTNLDGLANLASVGEDGDISIIGNAALTNLDGLANIVSVGDELDIVNNDALTNINGLANISSVEGRVHISENAALTNLDGLANLVSVGDELEIKSNHSLTNCCGIYPLLCTDPPDCTNDGVGGSITIENNPLACNNVNDITDLCTPQLWDTRGLARMPTARNGCTASVLDGKIYVIGGIFNRYGPPTAKVEMYDPVSNSWDTTIADLPSPLFAPVSEVVDGKIYVLGGLEGDSSQTPTDRVFVYDPEIRGNWVEKGPIPIPRSWHSSAVIQDSIYLFGGLPLIDTTFMYVPGSEHWYVKPKLPAQRITLSSKAVGDTMYTMGGLLGNVYSYVFAYLNKSDEWIKLKSMPGQKMGAGSAVMKDSIYIFGGWSNYPWPDLPGDFSPGTWKYTTTTDTWVDINADMPDEIAGFAEAVGQDSDSCSYIYAFGGALPEYWTQGPGPQVSDRVIRLKVKGCSPISSVEAASENGDADELITVYPNPFSYSTKIRYHLKSGTHVTVKIFDLSGRELTTLVDTYQAPGEYEVDWNVEGLPSGVYVYRLQTENTIQARPGVLVQ